MKPTLALLGTGILGKAMGERLLDQGFPLRAWNRTPSKASSLESRGARIFATPAEACREAWAALVVVADSPALEETVFGPRGAARGLASGTLLLQSSTVSPQANREASKRLAAQGIRFLETPVLGSRGEARTGTLVVMAGGEGGDMKEAGPILGALAKKVVYTGPAGSASVLKLALNQMIACFMGTLAQALVLVESAGIPREALVETLRESALWAPMLEKKLASTLATGKFQDPNFPLRHLLKDLRLAEELAEELKKELPLASAARGLLEEALKNGLGDLDYSALYLELQRNRKES